MSLQQEISQPEFKSYTSPGAYQPYGSRGLKGFLSNRYCVIACLYASLGGFSFGYDQGFFSVILVSPIFANHFPRLLGSGASFWTGLMTAILELGGAIGALNMGWVADRISRKWTMTAAGAVLIVGAVIQTAANNYPTLVVGRLVGGFGIGALAAVCPLYMSEIAPAEIRGSLMVLEEWFIVVGAIVAYWISYGTRNLDNTWAFRAPFLLQIAPVVILISYVPFLPYSPRWLASRGRNTEALRALVKIRGVPASDPRIQREYLDIVIDCRLDNEATAARHPTLQNGTLFSRIKLELHGFLDLLKPRVLRRTFTGIAVVFFQEFSGINGVIYYAPTLFATLGLTFQTTLIVSGIINVFQLIGVTAAIPLTDRVGRRPLLAIGAIGMLCALSIVAVFVGLYHNSWAQNSSKGWAGVSMIFFYMVAFGVSWGPIPWSMPSEIFPTSMRAKGVGLTIAFQWGFNFIVGLITPPMIKNIGFGTYIFYGALMLLALFWTIYLAPETRGVSLEAMDFVFKDNLGHSDAVLRGRIEKEISASMGTSEKDSDILHQPDEKVDAMPEHIEHSATS